MAVKKENLIGKTVKVIANTNSHGLPVGTVCKITMSGGNGIWRHDSQIYPGSNLRRIDFELYAQTKEEIIKTLEELEESYKIEKDDLSAKLDYLKETDSTEVDETEFKVYRTLIELDNKRTSKKDKARIIAKLINS